MTQERFKINKFNLETIQVKFEIESRIVITRTII